MNQTQHLVNRPLAVIIGSILATGFGVSQTQAATITVNSLADGSDPSACTLRDAVRSANNNASYGGCQAGEPGMDTIEFSVTGTIQLTNGALNVTDDLTIAGPGAEELTVDGNNLDRVLDVIGGGFNGDADNVVLSDITITGGGPGGFLGGGIRLQGTETALFERVHIVNNPRGGIYDDFTYTSITIHDSVISGNGNRGINTQGAELLLIENTLISNNATGGIWARGDLRIYASEIRDNFIDGFGAGGIDTYLSDLVLHDSIIADNSAAGVGGGVFFHGYTMDIQRTAIYGNSATDSGGGVFAQIFHNGLIADSAIHDNTSSTNGGGLMIRQAGLQGGLQVVNTTISGNQASRGGGVYVHRQATGEADLEHVTIADNIASSPSMGLGGGISYRTDIGTLQLRNTIVHGNAATDGNGHDLVAWSAPVPNPSPGEITLNETVSLNFSLVGDISGFTPDGTGNLFAVDPLLGPLADNGGPTLTHLPDEASPVIDVGDPDFTGPAQFDQRGEGFPRVLGGRTDMGAVEIESDVIFADAFEGN